MKKEELIKKYMNNELCIKRNGASYEEIKKVESLLDSKYCNYGEFETRGDYKEFEQIPKTELITVQDFLKACEESDKEEDYSHLIGKEVEVRDGGNEVWYCRIFRGCVKDKNGNNWYFTDSPYKGNSIVSYAQMREKQETIHLEKGDYTKEELEAELNKFKNK